MDNPVGMAYKLIFGVVLVAGIFTTGYFFGWRNQHDSLVRYKSQVEQANKDAIAAKNSLILEGSNQHEKDQALIDFLRTESGSVRVHIPRNCPDSQGKADPGGASGVLPNEIDSALAEVQEGDRTDAYRCDTLNAEAIESNTANR